MIQEKDKSIYYIDIIQNIQYACSCLFPHSHKGMLKIRLANYKLLMKKQKEKNKH